MRTSLALVKINGGLTLAEAAPKWLHDHAQYVRPSTMRGCEQYVKVLLRFFGDRRLHSIDIQDIRDYQAARKVHACNSRINQEVWALTAILREAGLWTPPLSKLHKPLPISKKGSGQAFTKDEEERILHFAFLKRKRHLTAHCLRIMLRTGIGFGELRSLHRRDVDIDQKRFFIPEEGAKNEERQRQIPIGPDALDSMVWIINRWRTLGGSGPDDHLLPQRPKSKHGPWIFEQPMTSIKTAWYHIIKDAGLEGSPWNRLRIYDCRVTAITRVLSSTSVSLHTAKRLFGHVSEQMQRRYFKPDLDNLRDAVAVLDGGGAK